MSNKNHIPYGIVTALILFVIFLVTYFGKMTQEKWPGILTWIILAAGVILSCIDFAKKNPDQTFGNIFANGFKTTAVITIISLLLTIIFILLFPGFKEQSLELARTQMEKSKASEDVIQKALETADKMFYTFMIAGSIFLNLVIGLIASLIGAAVAPKGQKI